MSTSTSSSSSSDNGLIVIIISFLAVCIFVYIVVTMFMHIAKNQTKYEDKMYKLIDMFSILLILIFVGFEYYNNADNQDHINERFKQFLDYLNDPYSIVSVFIFLLAVYLTMYFLRLSVDTSDSIIVSVIHNGSIILIFLMVIVDFFKYVFQINLIEAFMKYLNMKQISKTSNTTTPTESLDNMDQMDNIESFSAPIPNRESSTKDVAYYNENSNQFFENYMIG